jgi:trans-2,3-dihydro-3-hydroxyanthranilate isomerase
MATYGYHLVDVFTKEKFGGNPLAVFLDAEPLPEILMQPIAKELNLSETTFVTRPDDGESDFRVRIFTPARELPMAGHPTVGTAFVMHHQGVIPTPGNTVFQEGVGPVPVELSLDDAGRVVATMNQPLPTFGPIMEDRVAVAKMLSIPGEGLLPGYPIQIVDTGVPFLYVPIQDLETIAQCRLRHDRWEVLNQGGLLNEIFMFTPQTVHETSTVHSRMFAPAMGIAEDPATGAAAGPLGAYLVKYGLAPAGTRIINEQGFEMGRPSLIYIEIQKTGETFTAVRVGGHSVYMGRGELTL